MFFQDLKMIMFKTLKWTHFVTAQSRLPSDATWRQCGFAKEGGTVILRQFAMFALNFFLYDHQATNRTTANNQQIRKGVCAIIVTIWSSSLHIYPISTSPWKHIGLVFCMCLLFILCATQFPLFTFVYWILGDGRSHLYTLQEAEERMKKLFPNFIIWAGFVQRWKKRQTLQTRLCYLSWC